MFAYVCMNRAHMERYASNCQCWLQWTCFVIVINSQQVKIKHWYSEINFNTRYEPVDKQETQEIVYKNKYYFSSLGNVYKSGDLFDFGVCLLNAYMCVKLSL